MKVSSTSIKSGNENPTLIHLKSLSSKKQQSGNQESTNPRNALSSYNALKPKYYSSVRKLPPNLAKSDKLHPKMKPSWNDFSYHGGNQFTGTTTLSNFSTSTPHTIYSAESVKYFKFWCLRCHYTTGIKICLAFYISLAIFGLCFGMLSAVVWLIIPICVASTTFVGIAQRRHRYLYPFLIISVVHLIVCIVMTIIILLYSLFSYESMKLLVAKAWEKTPIQQDMIYVVASTTSVCLLMTVLHLIQIHVIYGCMKFFEVKLQMAQLRIEYGQIEEDQKNSPINSLQNTNGKEMCTLVQGKEGHHV